MPAPGTGCIDYTSAKLIYAATGSLKEAHEKTGIGYEAIRTAAHRHDWKTEVKAAAEMVQQNVTMAIGGAAMSREQKNNYVRDGHADAAVKIVEQIKVMDGQELFMSAQLLQQHAKHAALTFGWQGGDNSVTVRLDVLAGQTQTSPVIDISD